MSEQEENNVFCRNNIIVNNQPFYSRKIGRKERVLRNKILVIIALAVSISFLSGCVNYSENMTLNKDFSGKVSIKLAMSNMMFGMMGESSSKMLKDMEESFKSSEKIKLIDSKTYNELDNQVFAFDIEFNSIEDFNMIRENDKTPPFLGEVSLVKGKDGKVTLKRVISGSDNQEVNQEMRSTLAGYKWTYELKTPFKILEANTVPSYIDRKTNTVKWEVPLFSILSEPQEMTVTMETFNPIIYLYLIGILVVILLAVFGMIVIKRKKQVVLINE